LFANFSRIHLPVILWCAVIFVSSSIPSNRLPSVGVMGFDKLVHFGIYLVLCSLIHRSFRDQSMVSLIRRHSIAASIVACILYGATDEFHQLFVLGRSASVYDLLANGLGGFTYSLYWHMRGRKGADA